MNDDRELQSIIQLIEQMKEDICSKVKSNVYIKADMKIYE